MILITDVTTVEIDEDKIDELRFNIPTDWVSLPNAVGGRTNIETKYVREIVYGRRFVRPDGQTIAIAYSSKAEEVIGLTYEAFQNAEDLSVATQDKLYNVKNDYNKTNKELIRINKILDRIKSRKLYKLAKLLRIW